MKLKNLKKLTLLSCDNLLEIPEGFEDLVNLQDLNLRGCGSLRSLPEGFGELVNLAKKSFMAAIKHVQTLPEGIVEHPHLRDATELDLSGSNLVTLPERFGELKSLTSLDLTWCQKLVALPERFGDLVNLKKLNLRYSPAGRNMSTSLEAQLKARRCTGNGW